MVVLFVPGSDDAADALKDKKKATQKYAVL